MANTQKEKYQDSIDQRRFSGRNGYLKVEGLLTSDELRELDEHTMNLAMGTVDFSKLEGVSPRNEGGSTHLRFAKSRFVNHDPMA